MIDGLGLVYNKTDGTGAAYRAPQSTFDPVAFEKTNFLLEQAKKEKKEQKAEAEKKKLFEGITIDKGVIDWDNQNVHLPALENVQEYAQGVVKAMNGVLPYSEQMNINKLVYSANNDVKASNELAKRLNSSNAILSMPTADENYDIAKSRERQAIFINPFLADEKEYPEVKKQLEQIKEKIKVEYPNISEKYLNGKAALEWKSTVGLRFADPVPLFNQNKYLKQMFDSAVKGEIRPEITQDGKVITTIKRDNSDLIVSNMYENDLPFRTYWSDKYQQDAAKGIESAVNAKNGLDYAQKHYYPILNKEYEKVRPARSGVNSGGASAKPWDMVTGESAANMGTSSNNKVVDEYQLNGSMKFRPPTGSSEERVVSASPREGVFSLSTLGKLDFTGNLYFKNYNVGKGRVVSEDVKIDLNKVSPELRQKAMKNEALMRVISGNNMIIPKGTPVTKELEPLVGNKYDEKYLIMGDAQYYREEPDGTERILNASNLIAPLEDFLDDISSKSRISQQDIINRINQSGKVKVTSKPNDETKITPSLPKAQNTKERSEAAKKAKEELMKLSK